VLLATGESVRAPLQHALERDPRFEVIRGTSSAAAAVRTADLQRVDIALLEADLQTSGDGVAACREIAARHPHTLVVMISNSDTDQELLEAVRAGCTGYVHTDLDQQRLPDTLWHAAHESGAAFPPRLVNRLLVHLREPDTRRRRVATDNTTPLTNREWHILDLLAGGLTTRQVAEQLRLTPATIRSHRARIRRKLHQPPTPHKTSDPLQHDRRLAPLALPSYVPH